LPNDPANVDSSHRARYTIDPIDEDTMIRRLLLALLLLGSSLRADAGFFTDIWYNVLQSGQGYNLVQTDDFIFITFFIYDENGDPTFVIATLFYDGVSSYTGDLIATKGTFFGIPWVGATEQTVGTAAFTPSAGNAYEGTLAYTYTGRGSVNVAITRQTLLPFDIAGRYEGNTRGTYSACANAADNNNWESGSFITVTQQPDQSVTLAFGFDGGLRCSLAGTLIQNGLLYRIAGATYTCNDGLSTTADVSELRRTAQGLEGRLFAAQVLAGCTENARFSALATQ
jgi:hypothetical protein